MTMMAATVPTEGYVEHMVPKIASVLYYATPENEWAELIHPASQRVDCAPGRGGRAPFF